MREVNDEKTGINMLKDIAFKILSVFVEARTLFFGTLISMRTAGVTAEIEKKCYEAFSACLAYCWSHIFVLRRPVLLNYEHLSPLERRWILKQRGEMNVNENSRWFEDIKYGSVGKEMKIRS